MAVVYSSLDGDGAGVALQKLPQQHKITSTSGRTRPPLSSVLVTV
jgi:hypothetical protein